MRVKPKLTKLTMVLCAIMVVVVIVIVLDYARQPRLQLNLGPSYELHNYN